MTPTSDHSNWDSPECHWSSFATTCLCGAAVGTALSLDTFRRTDLLTIKFLETKRRTETGWGEPCCTSALAAKGSSSVSGWFLNYKKKENKMINQTNSKTNGIRHQNDWQLQCLNNKVTKNVWMQEENMFYLQVACQKTSIHLLTHLCQN
jgi:hypothetical protein